MRTYQLLTYHLRTPKAAKAYGQILADHMEGLRFYGIETHGVYASPSQHNALIALVSYSSEVTPEITVTEYLDGAKLWAQRAGFDLNQIIRADVMLLNPFSLSLVH
ncbi:NIPSNAP family protein [Granulicella sp. S156]|uniref:NIPSNAP family protein n=1 Tax=Granulicella sp. S156 TaxID=1747224 RepID=UPI00131B19F4|nr:NIPSNAP family protein [Granulicella sp. S156]